MAREDGVRRALLDQSDEEEEEEEEDGEGIVEAGRGHGDGGGEGGPSAAQQRHLRTRFISSERLCRICLEDDDEPDNPLIAPCICRGSAKYVHRECLQQWRCTNPGMAWSRCTVCLQPYVLVRPKFAGQAPATLGAYSKFLSLVAFDFITVFFAVQLLLGALACYLYFIDTGRHAEGNLIWGLIKCGGDDDPHTEDAPSFFEPDYFCLRPFVAYYLLAVVISVALMGLASLPTLIRNLNWDDWEADGSSCMCLQLAYYCAFFEWLFFGSSFVLIAVGVLAMIFLLAGVVFAVMSATVYLQTLVQNRVRTVFKRRLAADFIVACLERGEDRHPPTLPESAPDDDAESGGTDEEEGEGDGVVRGRAISLAERQFLIDAGLI